VTSFSHHFHNALDFVFLHPDEAGDIPAREEAADGVKPGHAYTGIVETPR
jgi:hypothetical protein